MSKITFRADDDLVEAVEELDASKSEIMREALRAYLDRHGGESTPGTNSLDAVLADRVDALVEERLAEHDPLDRDVNVDVTIEHEPSARVPSSASTSRARADGPVDRERPASGGDACDQCGEPLAGDHVYCPNCGEKAARRLFCECGDEIRSDWAFCPSCGRRTPSADVLDGV